jgi:hypothetical protein
MQDHNNTAIDSLRLSERQTDELIGMQRYPV